MSHGFVELEFAVIQNSQINVQIGYRRAILRPFSEIILQQFFPQSIEESVFVEPCSLDALADLSLAELTLGHVREELADRVVADYDAELFGFSGEQPRIHDIHLFSLADTVSLHEGRP